MSEEIRKEDKEVCDRKIVRKSRKNCTYLKKMKDQGTKLVQFCPGTRDEYFTLAAEMAGLDICRLISDRWQPAGHWACDVDEMMEALKYTIKKHRNVAPLMHINAMPESPMFCNVNTAVERCTPFIESGADSLLTMGIKNEVVKELADAYIPTFSHIGIISGWQTNAVGAYKRVGKTAEDALAIFKWGYEYQENGMRAFTIENTPMEVSQLVADTLEIPVISIAGGAACDGSEMVDMDLFGMMPSYSAHALVLGDFFGWATDIYGRWAEAVRSGAYPEDKHGYHMDPVELEKFKEMIAKF